MGKIILSCGHEDHEKPTGWLIMFGEEHPWKVGEKAIISGGYCSRCTAARILMEPNNTFFVYEEAEGAVFGEKE